MMHSLWNLSGILAGPNNRRSRERWFRGLSTVFFGLIGLVIWLIIRCFELDSVDCLICFVGYPAVFCGLFGSSIQVLNMNDDAEE